MTQAITRSMGGTVAGNGPARLLLWGAGLAFSVLVAASLYAVAARTVEDDARQRFNGIARGAQSALAARLTTFSELVRGMTALFQAADAPVTRLQFHRYVEALDIARHFPAIEHDVVRRRRRRRRARRLHRRGARRPQPGPGRLSRFRDHAAGPARPATRC